MTSAGSEAGTGQAGQAADVGHGAPGPEQASQDAAAGQAEQPAAARPVSPGPAPPQPLPPEPVPPQPVLPEQSREDTDIAWGDYRSRDDEDRDRLYRDRPPHWADY
ncbi:MAG TPA: hypothetical protein VMI73_01130 [Trebonia sp.]|nr:hypothetical protein [Trebonia sp.]